MQGHKVGESIRSPEGLGKDVVDLDAVFIAQGQTAGPAPPFLPAQQYA
jgi:hypothetical protein